MKKGFLMTLVVVAALLSSTGFSAAPVLNNVPDIIIGDAEQGTNNNVFVFTDAFSFDSYVTDADSTISELKWSFANDAGTPTILINGLGAETNDLTHLNPTNDIRDGATDATFKNETLSPNPTNPDPTTLANATLALYVSDGTKKDSQVITVYSVDGGQDGFSGFSGVTPVITETYTAKGSWDILGVGANTAPSSYGRYNSALHRLEISWPQATFTDFIYSQWIQWNGTHTGAKTDVLYAADHLYVLKALLQADENDLVPQVRLRVQAEDNAWTATAVYGGVTGQGGVPQTTASDFYMIWEPQGVTTANAFYAIDAYTGANTGEIYVYEVSIYSIPMSSVTSAAAGSVTNFSAWGKINSNVTVAAGSVTLGDVVPTEYYNTAGGYVTLPSAITAGDVYRLNYAIAKSGTAATEQVRLRVNDTANVAYVSMMTMLDRATAGANFQTTPKDYSVYHMSMNGRSSSPAGDLTTFIDNINVGASPSNTILSGIVIEKVTLPALN